MSIKTLSQLSANLRKKASWGQRPRPRPKKDRFRSVFFRSRPKTGAEKRGKFAEKRGTAPDHDFCMLITFY